jgi:hypothetical protein
VVASTVLREVSPLFDKPHRRQMFWAMRAEKLISHYLLQTELDRLAGEWARTMEQNCTEVVPPMPMKNGRMPAILQKITQVVHALRTMEVIAFWRRFFRIVEIVRALEYFETAIGSSSSLCKYAVAISQSDGIHRGFIVTVVEISACLIKNQEFVKDCDRDALMLWYKFEAVVNEMLQRDPDAAKTYWEVHDHLMCIM